MKHILMIGACAALLTGCDQQQDDAMPLLSGVDRSGFDDVARPQDDFNKFVNGGWIDSTEIPADKARWGSFDILREGSDKNQRTIIEELAAMEGLEAGTEEQQVGHLYASLMDAEKANALGAAPLADYLAKIDAISDTGGLVRAFAEIRKLGIGGPFLQFVNVDSADSSRYAVYLTQSGLSLPNRSYYLDEGERFDTIRARYPEYVAEILTMAGIDDGAAKAAAIYDLEYKIAEAHWTPVDNRNATKTNNRVAIGDLAEISGNIDFAAFLDAAGLNGRTDVFVRQPSYLTALGEIIESVPLDTWKDYLKFKVVNDAAPWLSDEFANAQFAFFGELIGGLKEQRPRWQRSVQAVNGLIGEAVGKVYVQRYFPAEAKERMDQLVANLLVAFEGSINELEWMSDETKVMAQEKRRKFTTKIGYPDEWKDYSSLVIDSGDAIGNLGRAIRWDYDRDLSRLDGPVDRGEWFMSPQTVNAYYNPRLGEIVFPAAILQPPFFAADADDAVNYGGIGAVIGHEIGHAFDDQGRKTDSSGNLNDWWTEADAEAFKAKAAALVGQYNGYEALPDQFVNGELTLGENIGDLTGVYIGYKAYQASLNGKEAPVIDGMTGDERFFYGFAQIWRGKSRDETTQRRLLTDPHSPGQFRANGPLRNFDKFYETFDVKEGDGMWLPPEERVKIW